MKSGNAASRQCLSAATPEEQLTTNKPKFRSLCQFEGIAIVVEYRQPNNLQPLFLPKYSRKSCVKYTQKQKYPTKLVESHFQGIYSKIFQRSRCLLTRLHWLAGTGNSVVAPNLWNIYVNRVLEINSEKVLLQAFADDLALLTAGSIRKELEINTNEALELIPLTLVELKLELSVGKCQGLAFRSLVRHQKRKGQNIFNRKPIFKINGQSIRIGESLKYLGVLLYSKLTWASHILTLHAKVYSVTNNFSRIIQTDWNLDKELVNIWYLTVIEKALLYGAGVWGGALTCEQIKGFMRYNEFF
ncbi:hypothetical protein AVEN_268883-1 [Araneus ventricosus]|uniref:Uncharacterized protein n=1 Tax=Araneus ventricosus TaxID=182803 RepID=A0A4Y2EXF9_ARAVE|nr:hypothetical protein AVEN_268883-1 [Araneus ventricosus]